MPDIALIAENADLVVDAVRAAEDLRTKLDPTICASIWAEALSRVGEESRPLCVLAMHSPEAQVLAALSKLAHKNGRIIVIAVLGRDEALPDALALAGDLGLVATDEVRPAIAALNLLRAGALEPWRAESKALTGLERARGNIELRNSGHGFGRLAREDNASISWKSDDDASKFALLGDARDAGAALAAMEAARFETSVPFEAPTAATDRAVREVLFGPSRALSDPTSKAALKHYGIPFPMEELCASPSRAASEATRFGYPVRIALASPDLRIWNHPDLAMDGVSNAAGVRDVFRQLTMLAESRAPGARVLGVTVTATTMARALLHAEAKPLGDDLVHLRIGFADAHGLAMRDDTVTALPTTDAGMDRALGRLLGTELIFDNKQSIRRSTSDAVHQTLRNLGRFVHDHRNEVTAVEMRPMALLVNGELEVRETCIHVSDAFSRELESPNATRVRSKP